MSQALPQDVDGYDPFTDMTSSEGTGVLTLDGLLKASIFSFDFNCVYNIVAVDINGVATGAWEIGKGQYYADSLQLSREVIIASSDTSGRDTGLQGDPVDLAAGVKFITFLVAGTPLQ